MLSLGQKIANLRNKKGKSQSQVAEELGIATSTLGMYETDKREPSNKMLETIADYFGTSTDSLLGRTSDDSTISLDEDKPYSYHGYNVPDKYLEMVRGLMDADIKEGKADKHEPKQR